MPCNDFDDCCRKHMFELASQKSGLNHFIIAQSVSVSDTFCWDKTTANLSEFAEYKKNYMGLFRDNKPTRVEPRCNQMQIVRGKRGTHCDWLRKKRGKSLADNFDCQLSPPFWRGSFCASQSYEDGKGLFTFSSNRYLLSLSLPPNKKSLTSHS